MTESEKIFTRLEAAYSDLFKDLMLPLIKPINNLEEKAKFLIDYENGSKGSPLFEYDEIDTQPYISELIKLKSAFKSCRYNYSRFYVDLINADQMLLLLCDKQRTKSDDDYGQMLTNIYGMPGKELTHLANSILEIKPAAANEKNLAANESAMVLRKALSDKKHIEWKVAIEDGLSKIAVLRHRKVVRISPNAMFDANELKRLIVHEIDTHVLRYENGLKQPHAIFSSGFPNYLETEEGLAVYAEECSNCIDNNDMAKYAMRVLLSANCRLSFFQLFQMALKRFSPSDSYDMVARIKRGLKNTNNPNGYTKDQIYLKGYYKIKKTKTEKLKKLFIGKVDLDNIDYIYGQTEVNKEITLPDWLINGNRVE